MTTATQNPPAPGTPAAPAAPQVVPPPGRPWTADDLLAYSHANAATRYELVQGELHAMSPASFDHSQYEGRLFFAIQLFVNANPAYAGTVLPGDAGYQLQAEPLTIRAPDVSYVRAERVPPRGGAAFPALAPDLAIEIISPSERAGDITDKVSDYLRAGVRLVWLVYPNSSTVVEYQGTGTYHIYRADDTLDGRDVLPGFRLALHELFA